MTDNDASNRMTETKQAILKALLSHVKLNQLSLSAPALRSFLAKSARITPHNNSLLRTIHLMEEEGYIKTTRTIAPGCKRKIEISINLTPKGIDKAIELRGELE